MKELTGEGRACIPVGLTRPKMVYLTEQSVLKSRRKKKKSLTGPGQPQTCSHMIYALWLLHLYLASSVSSSSPLSLIFGHQCKLFL